MFSFDISDNHFERQHQVASLSTDTAAVSVDHSSGRLNDLPGTLDHPSAIKGCRLPNSTDQSSAGINVSDEPLLRQHRDTVVGNGESMEVATTKLEAGLMQPEAIGRASGPQGLPVPSALRNQTPLHVSQSAGHISGRPKKKRKRRGMKPAEPALMTVRGFTPVASGDEDSDFSPASTPGSAVARLRDRPSAHGSPLARPASACSQGGISALKLQLDTLNLDSLKSSPMSRSQSQMSSHHSSTADGSAVTTTEAKKTMARTYEIPLEHDFISPDACPRPFVGPMEGGMTSGSTHRKICAADFEPLRCLGKGSYGTVLLVRQLSTGRLFAQKQLRKASVIISRDLVEQTKTERAILESVNRHPFVVKLYYAFHDHEKLYLILEFAQGGELCTYLAAERMFKEDVAAFYMAEMVLALEHLHRDLGVVYRDLKSENILLDADGHLLLTDFGLSKVPIDGDGQCKTMAGTDVYMAPEICQGKSYGTAVDWWSFGALGFDLLTGSPPFPGNNRKKIHDKIVHGKLQLPYYLTPDAKDLLTRLLRKEPSKRLGWNVQRDVQIIKNHRFFRHINWKSLQQREIVPPIKPLITDPELAENFASSFTDLALSPVVAQRPHEYGTSANGPSESDPFGGFSFVASSSLLDASNAEW